MNFLPQPSLPCCFAVAAINACRYEEVPHPSLCHLVEIGRGKHGPIVDQGRVLDEVPLDFNRKDSVELLEEESCGIVSIAHPQLNLHAAFFYEEDEDYYFVNSKLSDSLVEKRSPSSVPFPNFEHNRIGFYLSQN